MFFEFEARQPQKIIAEHSGVNPRVWGSRPPDFGTISYHAHDCTAYTLLSYPLSSFIARSFKVTAIVRKRRCIS